MPSAACADTNAAPALRALLVLIAHHPPADHVQRLQACLAQLGGAIETLLPDTSMTVVQRANPILPGLISRRFIPRLLKPRHLCRDDP